MNLLSITEISKLEYSIRGVYAWYYLPKISTRDLLDLRRDISEHPDSKYKLVENFLFSHLFNIFNETDYHASISGPLKATFKGFLKHQVLIGALTERISDDLSVLEDLKDFFEKSISPLFMSPIYIGLSDDLRGRLEVHKRLLFEFDEQRRLKTQPSTLDSTLEASVDHKFAFEVVHLRKMTITNLAFSYCPLDNYSEKFHVITENILNRLNYPLCGRN